MSIFLHIIFACLSIIITGITAFTPTRGRLVGTAVSIILTVASGVMLAVLDHAVIARVCTSGLMYLAIEGLGIAYAVHTLHKTHSKIEGSEI